MTIYLALPSSVWPGIIKNGITLREDTDDYIPVLFTEPEMLEQYAPIFALDYMELQNDILLFELDTPDEIEGSYVEQHDDYSILVLAQIQAPPEDLHFKMMFDALEGKITNIRNEKQLAAAWERDNEALIHGLVPWTAKEYKEADQWLQDNETGGDWENVLVSYMVKRYGKERGIHHVYRHFRIVAFLNKYLERLEADDLLFKGRGRRAAIREVLYEVLCTIPYNHNTGLSRSLHQYTFEYDEVVKRAHEIMKDVVQKEV